MNRSTLLGVPKLRRLSRFGELMGLEGGLACELPDESLEFRADAGDDPLPVCLPGEKEAIWSAKVRCMG